MGWLKKRFGEAWGYFRGPSDANGICVKHGSQPTQFVCILYPDVHLSGAHLQYSSIEDRCNRHMLYFFYGDIACLSWDR